MHLPQRGIKETKARVVGVHFSTDRQSHDRRVNPALSLIQFFPRARAERERAQKPATGAEGLNISWGLGPKTQPAQLSDKSGDKPQS